jgi:signal transduction histidine kinase
VAVVAALLFVMISRAITAQTDKLRLSHQALEKAHSHVEEQVRERTAELLVAKEQAESADRTKSAFLAVMSHELRTPLNSIIGFTDIVIRELAGPLNAEQKKQLGMVQNSGRHLLALINDVLDISKIEAGELKLQPAPFDVGKSVVKVTDIIRPQAGSKQLALSVEVQSGIGAVTGDARRFEQILLNLLSNAVKFTERGSVAVRCISQGGWLEVQVEDTGMGIAPEDLALLFQPFKQVDSRLARKFEGTGLGLSICKRLAQMMGGTISVSSEPGRGSTFAVRLPIIGETQ